MVISDIKWGKLLNKSFKDFDESELCFLALTSKPEAVIRNKVAWNLYRHQDEFINTSTVENCVVGRECSRIDMAVFNKDGSGDSPLLGVEFKTATAANMIHYSFRSDHIEDFENDLIKRNGTSPLITIFYEALEVIDNAYSNVIKYHGRHNKIENHSTTNKDLQEILEEDLENTSVEWIPPFTAYDYLQIGVRFHCFILKST